MASFIRNTFDNICNNISSTLNSTNTRPPNAQSNFRFPFGHRSTNRPPETNTSGAQTRSRSNLCGRSAPTTHIHQFRPQPASQGSMSNTGPSSTTNSANKVVDKFDIQDVRDPNDIKTLSATQLKTILTRNCVDYKGVFEKEVLREKVMQLWIDHNESKARRKTGAQDPNLHGSQDDSDEIDENQLCKICMEREINCVLLECGHYLTCVTCGRKLAECPICRQNVSRCVRTFKG